MNSENYKFCHDVMVSHMKSVIKSLEELAHFVMTMFAKPKHFVMRSTRLSPLRQGRRSPSSRLSWAERQRSRQRVETARVRTPSSVGRRETMELSTSLGSTPMNPLPSAGGSGAAEAAGAAFLRARRLLFAGGGAWVCSQFARAKPSWGLIYGCCWWGFGG